MHLSFWLIAAFLLFGATWLTIGTAIVVGLRDLPRRERSVALLVFFIVFVSLSFRAASGGGLLVSDSVEYFSIARRIFFEGRIDLHLAGQDLPSRFQPWFSLAFLVPIHLFTHSPGLLSVGIALTGALSVLGAGLIAARMVEAEQKLAAFFVAAAISTFIPSLRYFSLSLMTDVPSTLLVLVLVIFATSGRGTRAFASSASIFMLTLMRPLVALTALLGLFVARQIRHLTSGIVAVSVGCVLIALLNCVQFGSLTRSGYNFWMPLPYESFGLVFNVAAISTNLRELRNDPGMFLVAMGWLSTLVFWKTQNDSVRSVARVFWGISFGLFAGHISYFYPSVRFQLPAQLVAAAVCTGVLFSFPLSPSFVRRLPILAALFIVVLVFPSSSPRGRSADYASVTQISRCLPNDASLVTDRNVLLVEMILTSDGARTIIPWSRDQEYASKVILRRALAVVPDGALDSWRFPDRVRALIPQAEEVYPWTAVENWSRIQANVREGKRVFVDVTNTTFELFDTNGVGRKDIQCGEAALSQLVPLK